MPWLARHTGIAIGIRIVLGKMLQLADIHFPDQCGDILIVFVARFSFGDRDLCQNGRPNFYYFEFGDVTTEIAQAFGRPGRHDSAQITVRYRVLFFKNVGIFLRVEQAKWLVVDRATLAIGAQPAMISRRLPDRADTGSVSSLPALEWRVSGKRRSALWHLPCRRTLQRPDSVQLPD